MEKAQRRTRRSRDRSESRAPGLRHSAVTGFVIGLAMGSLFGAMINAIPRKARPKESDMLSVNQRTGRAQLHIKGKPEIR